MLPETREEYNDLIANLDSMSPVQLHALHGGLAEQLGDLELPSEAQVGLSADTEVDGATLRVMVQLEGSSPEGIVIASGHVDYQSKKEWGSYSEAVRKLFAERTGIPALVPILRAAVLDTAARLNLELPQLGLYKSPTLTFEEITESSTDVSVDVEGEAQAARALDGQNDQPGR